MRRMSFALTTEQVINKTKTVTRRKGWQKLKPGDLLQPVVKCMGLKKGEKQQLIGGPIEVVSVSREPVIDIKQEDVIKEGFPDWNELDFIEMYCRANKCHSFDLCTRIEFRYTTVAAFTLPRN